MKKPKRYPLLHEAPEIITKVSKELGLDPKKEPDRSKVLSQIERVFQETLQSPIYVYGKRTQNVFFEMVKSLGRVKLIKQEDKGDVASAREKIKIPDYRIVTSENKTFFVEVKNYKAKISNKRPPFPPFKIRKKDYEGYKDYAELCNLPLKYAIFWRDLRLWTLSDHRDFSENGKYCSLTFSTAMKNNEMTRLGDYMVATRYPLKIRIDFEPTKIKEGEKEQLVNFKIQAVGLFSQENLIKDKEMQQLAFALMLYGGWKEETITLEKDNTIYGIEFHFEPSVEENKSQPPELKLYLSTLFTNMYLSSTESTGALPEIYPSQALIEVGKLVPNKPFGRDLPLWLFHLNPSHDWSKVESDPVNGRERPPANDSRYQTKGRKTMNIACLGWGSLIWDPFTLPVRKTWFHDGPLLPIEFMRHSGGDRITLVISMEASCLRTLWALMTGHDLDEAKKALADREGTSLGNIGWYSLASNSGGECVDVIGAWAKCKGLDAVIWTALPPKFDKKNGRVPSIEEVISFLRKLPYEKRKNAEHYIRMAPLQIDTDYRRRFENEFGWEPMGTSVNK